MDATIAIGNNSNVDGYEAAVAAAGAVRDELGPEGAEFMFVFSTIGYEQEDVLDGVREIMGDVPMCGATFEGIIGRGIADESMYAIQVVGIRSERIKFYSFCAEDTVLDALESGRRIGREIAAVTHPGNRVALSVSGLQVQRLIPLAPVMEYLVFRVHADVYGKWLI